MNIEKFMKLVQETHANLDKFGVLILTEKDYRDFKDDLGASQDLQFIKVNAPWG